MVREVVDGFIGTGVGEGIDNGVEGLTNGYGEGISATETISASDTTAFDVVGGF